RRFALDRDVDPASLALEPRQQRAPDSDELVEGRFRRPVEERRERRNGSRDRKREVQLLPEFGRRQGAVKYVPLHRRSSRDADAPTVAHPEIRTRFFGGTG